MNAIHPLEPGAMDILDIKRRYGDRITLVGNVDINDLTLAPPETIRKKVLYLLEKLSPGGNYILSSSNSLTNYVKPENVQAMGEAKKNWNTRLPIF